ncbi:MAG: TIGR04372 family glycosyltransferase [Proteobacteria bacterium]|nr:TIGR04372 family glycosyltransferase [Pseudomonadota bacterium]MBI3496988.1 TIGR04372 family glycosyltransferase [Pseudomonadota bacterium]
MEMKKEAAGEASAAEAAAADAAGDRPGAARHYRKALLRQPDQGECLFRLGRIASDLGNLVLTRALIGRAVACRPEASAYHLELASLREMSGNLPTAIASRRRALALAPDDADAIARLGHLLRRLHAIDAADRLYRRALSVVPKLGQAHLGLGLLAEARAAVAEARMHFERMADQVPGALARIADVGLRDHAALDLGTDAPNRFTALGETYFRANRIPEAVTAFCIALSMDVDHARAKAMLNAVMRRQGRTAVLFRLLVHPSFGIIAVEADLLLRHIQAGSVPREFLCILLSGNRPANRQLTRLIQRATSLVEDDLLYYAALEVLAPRYMLPEGVVRLMEFDVGFNARTRPPLTFSAEELAEGQAYLEANGLNPKQDWFVCIYARDISYSQNVFSGARLATTDFRNADIATFVPAIQAIIAAGGWVFRIGKDVARPLPLQHERVIDYAASGRSDLLDLFLLAHCRFFLGTPAGPGDAGRLFNMPCLYVNAVPPGFCPFGAQTIYISKKLRHRNGGAPVRLADYLALVAQDPSMLAFFSDDGLASAGLVYEDNTPEEIEAATKEMLARVAGSFSETELDQSLRQRYLDAFRAGSWSGAAKRVSMSSEAGMPLGAAFLRRYQDLLLPD